MNPFLSILIAIVLSLLVGLLGKNRNIGFGWSFVLSLFLSPIIGLIITLFSKRKDVEFINVNKDDYRN